MSVSSKKMPPAVGSMSRSRRRPTVVLPHPDSPDQAERLAALDDQVDAVHGAHLGHGALEQPGRMGNDL